MRRRLTGRLAWCGRLAATLVVVVMIGCGQGSRTVAVPPASQPAEATPTPTPADPRALSEDLTFTGALSGHVVSATATGNCGPRTDASGYAFEGTINMALADGIHGFRVRWAYYSGPGASDPGTTPVFISISPAGVPDDLYGANTYYAPRGTLTVAADERSGAVDGDYLKYEWGVGSPFDGRPPPPILGHVRGAWRCAK